MFYEKISLGEGAGVTVFARSVNPENTPKRRPALLLIPGGGYNMISFREGEPVALRFLAEGFAVFLLEYPVQTAYPAPLAAAAAALRFLRANAEKYAVDPAHIAAAGFSAGGHLTALLGTMSEEDFRFFPKTERPAAILLGYPVVSTGAYTHEESAAYISGGDQALRARLSAETRVTAESSPAFLWHTCEDGLVPAENTLLFAEAYRRAGVPFELHLFERGGHGLSTVDAEVSDGGYPAVVTESAGQWLPLAFAWLRGRGFCVR